MTDENIKDSEDKIKSVDLAYELALTSYDTAFKQLDNMDARIQTLMAFGTTVSLALPAIFMSKGISFASGWFVAAVLTYILAIAVGIYARLTGDLTLPNPKILHKDWLDFSVQEFKEKFTYYAGEHFDKHTDLSRWKWQLLTLMSLLFLLQGILLVLWAARLDS
jgi:hypothetical protein